MFHTLIYTINGWIRLFDVKCKLSACMELLSPAEICLSLIFMCFQRQKKMVVICRIYCFRYSIHTFYTCIPKIYSCITIWILCTEPSAQRKHRRWERRQRIPLINGQTILCLLATNTSRIQFLMVLAKKYFNYLKQGFSTPNSHPNRNDKNTTIKNIENEQFVFC